MSALWYYERLGHGKWWPVTSTVEPRQKKGRLVRVDGLGPSIRGIKPVPSYLQNLSLDQLSNVLGSQKDIPNV